MYRRIAAVGLAAYLLSHVGASSAFATPPPTPTATSTLQQGTSDVDADTSQDYDSATVTARTFVPGTRSSGSGGGGPGQPAATGDTDTTTPPIRRFSCDTDGTSMTCIRVYGDDPTPTPPETTAPIDIEGIAISVAAAVHLPEPTIGFGPDPAGNKWNMIPVGYPMWLWTENRTALANSATTAGLTVALTATPGTTTFTMGDGSKVTCNSQPHWIKGNTQKSPCSYTYQYPSPDNDPYIVTATTQWAVRWYAADQSGTLTLNRTATRPITIGELHSLRER